MYTNSTVSILGSFNISFPSNLFLYFLHALEKQSIFEQILVLHKKFLDVVKLNLAWVCVWIETIYWLAYKDWKV